MSCSSCSPDRPGAMVPVNRKGRCLQCDGPVVPKVVPLPTFIHRDRYEVAYTLLVWELLKTMDPVTECVPWEKILGAMAKAAGELS